jgi:hypothetical protein
LPCPFRRALALGAIVFLALAIPAGRTVADEVAQERFEKTYELAGITRVRIQNINGVIRIETGDKDQLHVVAIKRAKASGAEDTLKQTEIHVTKTGEAILIETVLPKKMNRFRFLFWGRQFNVDVDYDVTLPAGIAVEAETVNGRILAAGRAGPLVLNTVNGSVKVESQNAPLKVNTVNGSVEVVFAGPMRKTDLETVNGSVTLSCSKDSSIRYDLQTVNGRILSEFASLNVEGKWGPKEARGEINGGRERLAVETVNGEVRLRALEAPVTKK